MLSKFLQEKTDKKIEYVFKNQDRYFNDIGGGTSTFFDKINTTYFKEMNEFEKIINDIDIYSLPTEEKLKVCINLLQFFQKYWIDPKQILEKGKRLENNEKICWEGLRLAQIRQIFRFICEILLSFNESFIRNYEALLQPNKKFTRKTFEYFGALMKLQPKTRNTFIFIQCEKYTDKIHEYFINEYNEREMILESAIENTIIKNEIVDFIEFLSVLLKNHHDFEKEYDEIELRNKYKKIFEFPGIYSVTKRIIDTNSLYELTLLTALENFNITNNIYVPTSSDSEKNKRKSVELSLPSEILTNKQKFEFLRKLQRIGELVTGKHLQTKITGLADEIDWSLLIETRDVISHQNHLDSDNYQKIKLFLEDKELVLKVQLDLFELHFLIFNLIGSRYEKTKAKVYDRKQNEEKFRDFWEIVLKEEIAGCKEVVTEEKKLTKPVYYLPTEEERKILESGLKKELSEKQLLTVYSVLNGEIILNGNQRGKFINEIFISKKEDKKLQKECSKILTKMMIEIKIRRTEEDFKKEKERERAQRLEKEREIKEKTKKTLIGIRELVFDLQKPTNFKLCKKECLIIAVDYLKEIRSFLVEIQGEICSIENKENFYKKIIKEKSYSGAFEYCVIQALSMICVAKENIEIVNACDYFKCYGKEFRDLRNWITHNNALLDFYEEFDKNLEFINLPDKIQLLVDFKNVVIYPVISHIILYLLPNLENILINLPFELESVSDNQNKESMLLCFFDQAKVKDIHYKKFMINDIDPYKNIGSAIFGFFSSDQQKKFASTNKANLVFYTDYKNITGLKNS